jgi:sialate O-acetylesterase
VKMRAIHSLLLAACWFAPETAPALELGVPWRDNAVLQRDVPLTVWGTAEPGAKITAGWAGKQVVAEADADGRWSVVLPPSPASDRPAEMTVAAAGGDADPVERKLTGLLVGEVWLCSGQSNMAMRLLQTDGGKDVLAAANDDLLRAFVVPERPGEAPVDTLASRWIPFRGREAREFSAMAYYFGERLRRELNVPVGLIVSAWPGSAVAAWLSPRALSDPSIAPLMPAQVHGWPPHHQPSNLYHGMIHPLVPFPLAGVIWYQGETDGMTPTQNPYAYRSLFRGLITDLRRHWRRDDLPFYWVQLPNLRGGRDWPVLRESQADALALPATGMIPTLDIGANTLLHPKNKDAYGRRMADLVLARQYGKGTWQYPAFAKAEKSGGAITVDFHGGEGLRSSDGQPVRNFELAGADGVFHAAEAAIDGTKVTLRSAAVTAPEFVRYAWSANPDVNLVNAAGLPAAPFRTDDLPVKGREFLPVELPAKSPLLSATTGLELLENGGGWTLTTDDEKARELVKPLARGLVYFTKDEPERSGAKFTSPTFFWTKPLKTGEAGCTVAVDLDMIRAGRFERGFDLEVVRPGPDGAPRRYLVTIFPMQIRAVQGNEVRLLAGNLDNTGPREYRLAVRADGIAQVYFDGRLIGVLGGEILRGETPESSAYARIGKTVGDGDFLMRLYAAGVDEEGAFTPIAGSKATADEGPDAAGDGEY